MEARQGAAIQGRLFAGDGVSEGWGAGVAGVDGGVCAGGGENGGVLDVADSAAVLDNITTGAANNYPHLSSADYDRLLYRPLLDAQA